ncbi:PAS domain-containing sensor histidine kinase [Trinickia dabaoshanensis]|uniref:histidine kinase n=1 Tax=Trinickia dabaoshanensis TaxID=564714 RepID=A0A2N7VRQ8_9BURK|nr:PAS domain-containing sensor histidine kinase [Trinickia dabaoshanensis]PMS19809.1 PAS domain-containing sensor histidine kinase [Trinickia dabaoshanensis]
MQNHILEGQTLDWLLSSAADALIIVDRDGRIALANPPAERLFGYSNQEMIGQALEILMPERFRAAHVHERVDYFSQLRARPMGVGMELRGQRKDGTEIPIEVSLSPLETDRGLKLVMATIHDVTLRKKAEQALRDSEARLRALMQEISAANEELTNFAYVVSHDLKAPLRGIGSLADWLSQDYADKFDEEGKEHMRLLIGRVHRMSALIDGILEYSRAGRIKETSTRVDLNVLLREVIDLLAPPPHIEIEVAGHLPALFADKTRIQQVFQNLLSNSIKYMDKPAGRIRVECAEQDDALRFSVSDNGPGIEKRHFERIFQLFQTLTPRDQFESTGVGLALVKKIVEMYGGQAWLESEVGSGSTFHFTLPRQMLAPSTENNA